MNDTREGTWGPIIIEKENYTDTSMLDSRPWDGDTSSADATKALTSWQGSAFRLVRNGKPCDYEEFIGSITQGQG